jgi:hypothetical protein
MLGPCRQDQLRMARSFTRDFDPYLLDGSTKSCNRNYSQWVGREELFEKEYSSNPEWQLWNFCVSACALAAERSITVGG